MRTTGTKISEQEAVAEIRLSPLLRLYEFSRRLRRYFVIMIDIGLTGFWLGILTRSDLHRLDESYYIKDKMYYKDGYNRQGLWTWEEDVVNSHFRQGSKLLLIGAGGGREIYGLRERVAAIDAFECNPYLADYANQFLVRHGVEHKVSVAERDVCPPTGSIYDGAIIGWGGYMLIQGRARRISLLKSIAAKLGPSSPILISFFVPKGSQRKYRYIANVANCFRVLLGRPLAEEGDYLEPNYVHYFTKEQIEGEVRDAGLELIFFSSKIYGHAVAMNRKSSPEITAPGNAGALDVHARV